MAFYISKSINNKLTKTLYPEKVFQFTHHLSIKTYDVIIDYNIER